MTCQVVAVAYNKDIKVETQDQTEKKKRVRPRLHQRESEGAARQLDSQLPPLQCQETTAVSVQCEFTSFPLRMYQV